ncbi:MAG: hypothetical protein Q4D98_09175 [Planctomycetia bacterium]|nr:hypothetical protein [Planctomycetia bacterium]
MRKGILTVLTVLFLATALHAATYRTKNFAVTAQDPQIAEQMARRAEFLREDLSKFWLGKTLPNWYKRCRIKIRIGDVAPGGQTSFIFNNGEVYGWDMDIQGTAERVYDSVLPHEMTHMILASYFRCPVPRWADEGAATFTESNAEREKYQNMLLKFLRSQKGIPLDKLFEMEEYPSDPLPLYAQGFSVAEFLIRQRGPQYFVYFIGRYLEGKKSLQTLIQECYGYETLRELQRDWVAWVSEGSPSFVGSNLIPEVPSVTKEPPIQLASATESVPEQPAADREATYADGSEPVGPQPLRPQPNLLMWTSSDMRNQP